MVYPYKMKKFKTPQTAIEHKGWWKCKHCGTPYPTKRAAGNCCKSYTPF